MSSANWVAVGVIFISTMLNAAYFMPIIYRAFMYAPDAPEDGKEPHGEAPFPIVLALTATAIGTVAMFFFPGVPFDLAAMLAGQ